jgi:hypothetical protein
MIKAENEEQGKWLSLNLEKQRIRAWIEMLLDFNYRLYITPIEFVEYDEKLTKNCVRLAVIMDV